VEGNDFSLLMCYVAEAKKKKMLQTILRGCHSISKEEKVKCKDTVMRPELWKAHSESTM